MNIFKKIILTLGLIIAGIIILIIFTGAMKKPRGIEVVVTVSPVDASALATEVIYSIKNTSDKTHEITSIDIDKAVLEQFALKSTSLPYVEEYTFNTIYERTYGFMHNIAPGESIDITFTYIGTRNNNLYTRTYVCIDGPGRCIERSTLL